MNLKNTSQVHKFEFIFDCLQSTRSQTYTNTLLNILSE